MNFLIGQRPCFTSVGKGSIRSLASYGAQTLNTIAQNFDRVSSSSRTTLRMTACQVLRPTALGMRDSHTINRIPASCRHKKGTAAPPAFAYRVFAASDKTGARYPLPPQ
jgi:hypothetical protein